MTELQLQLLLTFLNSGLLIFLIALSARIYKGRQKLFAKSLKDKSSFEESQLELLRKSLEEITCSNRAELQKFVRLSENDFGNCAGRLPDMAALRMREGTAQIIKDIRAAFDEEYKKAVSEIDRYKASEMQSIDARARELIFRVAKEVLPQSISLKDHYQLTVDALEKAKKGGFKL